MLQGPEQLDSRTERHMLGACMNGYGWVLVWCILYTLFIIGTIHSLRFGILVRTIAIWLLTILSGVGVPVLLYIKMGKPKGVSFGLIVNFFLWGGLGGCLFGSLMEEIMITLWHYAIPSCNLSTEPVHTKTACQPLLLFEWILTPGLWEELFKVIWVYLRFKSQPTWTDERCVQSYRTDAVPRRTCCISTKTCTCWWRLAKTPEAIFLGALAAGGGFESFENILYMFNNDSSLFMNFVRAVLCNHLLWTGYVGMRLAQRQFGPPNEQRSLICILLPVVFLHGLWDWCASGAIIPVIFWIPGIFFLSLGILVVPLRRGALSVVTTATTSANDVSMQLSVV